MIPCSARTAAEVMGGRIVGGDLDSGFTEAVIDSRQVSPDTCFFAILGPRDDGHRYLPQAIAAGATVIVLQREEALPHLANPTGAALLLVDDTTAALQALAVHVRQTVDPVVVAITGSVGKTTTKSLTYDLLRDSAPTHVTPGNFNNHWGLPLSLLGLEPEHDWMVAELGMSTAGEIARLSELAQPAVGVITNVAPVHMENFANLAGVAAAKRELAAGLDASGTLIVNADDPFTARMGAEFESRLQRVIRFGSAENSDVRATGVERSQARWQFTLESPCGDAVAVELPLPGEHSVANFLAAASAACAMGVNASAIAERAASLTLPAMRGQVRVTPDGIAVIDDSYNSSPAAMLSAIETLVASRATGRRILAAGDMLELGSWSEDAHREVGLHVAQVGIDRLVTVGPLARDIARGAVAGGLSAAAISSFGSSDEAADAIVDLVEPGDTVLIKGSRGIRMERLTRALLNPPTGRTN